MGEWDESAHPRDEKGRFGSSGGGGSESNKASGLKAFANTRGGGSTRPFAALAKYAKGNEAKREDLKSTIKEVGNLLKNGGIHSKTKEPVSLKDASLGAHIKMAKDMLRAHEESLPRALESLKSLSPSDAKVKGRVKDLHSALGKLVRKPEYGSVHALQDATGMRVVAKSIQEVKDTVARIKDAHKVVAEDNYIDKPNGDYRSHHLIIEHEGKQKEVQVRTHNQDQFADWSHNVYKPTNKEQAQVLAAHGPLIEHYSKAMADHFFALDSGKKSERPVAPEIVKRVFGEPGAPKKGH